MGTTKLKTAFKESVGCSVSEYIIRKRIDHAQHLLIATDLSIATAFLLSSSVSRAFFHRNIEAWRTTEME